jgi:hypothetical protein
MRVISVERDPRPPLKNVTIHLDADEAGALITLAKRIGGPVYFDDFSNNHKTLIIYPSSSIDDQVSLRDTLRRIGYGIQAASED